MVAPTFNLTALSDRLFDEKRMLPLAGKIRHARDLASIHTDLIMAIESLDALDQLFSEPPSDDFSRQITEFSLLINAVLLYARATKTTSKERVQFDILAKLTDAEKIVHQELVDLRDEAIAHFGSGGSYLGMWHVETVILQPSDQGLRVGVSTRRQIRDKKLAARARMQIEKAKALVQTASMKKIAEVTTDLSSMTVEEIEKEIFSHPINLDIMLSSPDAAATVRSAANQGGYSKGVVRHD
jgi:hypothetical protein